jgi:hypothetical protein
MSNPSLVALVPVEDMLVSLGLPDRRVTLHRLYADLYAASFPARAVINVVAIFCGGVGDFTAEAVLRDPMGREIARAAGKFTAAEMHTHLFNFQAMIETPGVCRIDGYLEGDLLSSVPLTVSLLGANGNGSGEG